MPQQRTGYPMRSVSDSSLPPMKSLTTGRSGLFLTTCGAATSTLFQILVAPKKPSEFAIAKLLKLAAAHYHLKRPLAVQHLCFYTCTCQVEESVTAHLAEWKRLPEHCSFGDTFNDMLWDKMVCEIQAQRTQCRVLAQPDLTLQKAFEVGQANDLVEIWIKQLQHSRTAEVHAVKPQFRRFRAPARTGISHIAPTNNRSSIPTFTSTTATHCDSSFTHLSFTPSQCIPQLRTIQQLHALQPQTPCLCIGYHSVNSDKCLSWLQKTLTHQICVALNTQHRSSLSAGVQDCSKTTESEQGTLLAW